MKLLSLLFASLACLAAGPALAADPVRLAVQKTGTLAWELNVVRTHGLDTAARLTVTSTELASPEAGKIALSSGTNMVIAPPMTRAMRPGACQCPSAAMSVSSQSVPMSA